MKKLDFVNSNNLRIARENIGYTTEFVSKHYFKKKEDVVLFWEKGEILPTLTQLKKLSKEYKISEILFLSKKDIKKNDNKDTIKDFRKNKDSKFNSDLQKLIYTVSIRQKNIERIFKEEGLFKNNIIGSGINYENPKDLAKHIIRSLNININEFRETKLFEDALKYLINKAEDKNIFVGKTFAHHKNIKVEDMRGVCLYHDYCPFIVINRKDAKSAQIFTLLHELSHIFKKTSAISNVIDFRDKNVNKEEVFCNKVAVEILLPEDSFFGNYNLERILNEFKIYKVAPITLFYRLKDLRKIEGDIERIERDIKKRSEEFNQQKGQKGGNHYNNMKDTNGQLYNKIISNLYLEEKISPIEAYNLLGMNPERV